MPTLIAGAVAVIVLYLLMQMFRAANPAVLARAIKIVGGVVSLAVAAFVGLPDDHMVFSGMALGYRDPEAPINGWRTRRDPLDVWCDMRGFEEPSG